MVVTNNLSQYKGAAKSLGRPGREKTSVPVGMAFRE